MLKPSLLVAVPWFVPLLACCAVAGLSPAAGAEPPLVLGAADAPFPVSGPDGAVDLVYSRPAEGVAEIIRKRTEDNGRTWSEKPLGLTVPANFEAPLALRTRDGELQLFWMVARGGRKAPAVDYLIDIWQACSFQSQTRWSKPQRIFEGYVGSINGMTELQGDRIVLPFAYWVAGAAEAPPTGCNITTVVTSDDQGATWKLSPARLTAPCYENYNGANYGAVEPSILELAKGRVWMLIRTQTGRLYESFSTNGSEWSEPVPSRFHSSDSPASLVRLPDNRIVLFWNNCENTSRIDGAGVYTNRDALHAAISRDQGRTWQGFREVYRDPLRNESPPKTGDRGVAYPYAAAAKDGKIVLVTGQGQGRRKCLLVDPNWLEETHARDDFSGGLEGWCVFKAFGPAVYWWRDRVQGPCLVDHPAKPGARALHVRRPDDKDGDGAVWNFPLGRRGKLAVRLSLATGFGGGSVAIADRFIQPTDAIGEKQSVFTLPIPASGRLEEGVRLEPNRWHTLSMAWDLDQGQCRVQVDDRQAGTLTTADSNAFGLSYLRLRSTAPARDPAGFLVESVEAEVR
ncbi:MAG: exo-alpha-sialidase [Pirellulales bacterium]|nr:exo-alpha-sialidase [Pirellulales bacterium]